LETGHEVSRPILKKNDEAESEKHKEQKPEKIPDETHARRLTYSLSTVNDWNTTISDTAPTARQSPSAMLR
jgi:hypothetical protein